MSLSEPSRFHLRGMPDRAQCKSRPLGLNIGEGVAAAGRCHDQHHKPPRLLLHRGHLSSAPVPSRTIQPLHQEDAAAPHSAFPQCNTLWNQHSITTHPDMHQAQAQGNSKTDHSSKHNQDYYIRKHKTKPQERIHPAFPQRSGYPTAAGQGDLDPQPLDIGLRPWFHSI